MIYYERVLEGRRIRFATKTDDWAEAVAMRDLYEQRRAEQRVGAGASVTFEAFAKRYLAEAAGHLAGSTRGDRGRLLGEGGCWCGTSVRAGSRRVSGYFRT